MKPPTGRCGGAKRERGSVRFHNAKDPAPAGCTHNPSSLFQPPISNDFPTEPKQETRPSNFFILLKQKKKKRDYRGGVLLPVQEREMHAKRDERCQIRTEMERCEMRDEDVK